MKSDDINKDDIFDEIKNNIFILTGYGESEKLKYYFDKLCIYVKDYCNREDLNIPLYNFVENKLLKFAKNEYKNKQQNDINGIGIENIKSISRGDTSITLKGDSNSQNILDFNVMDMNSEDYIYLNRHRKVYKI